MGNQLKQDDEWPFSADESSGCSHPAGRSTEHFVATRDELELLALHWIKVAADIHAFVSLYGGWSDKTIDEFSTATDRFDKIAVVIGDKATARICAEAKTKQSMVQVRRTEYLAEEEQRRRSAAGESTLSARAAE